MTHTWRPSAFVPGVVAHLAEDGQPARVSDDHPEERWVWAVCTSRALADVEPTSEHVRCPDCVRWLERSGTEGG